MELNSLLLYWSGLLLVTAVVAVLSWAVGKKEDDHLHFSDKESDLLASQLAFAHRLDVLGRWKRALLVATIVTGLGLAAMHLYNVWLEGAGLIQ